MKTLSEEPSEEQLAALSYYAEHHGGLWKQQLLDDWMTGRDASLKGGHLLRQLRNQFGPQWLEKCK